jgi:lysophospholipase L1-like esterase
LKRLRYGVYSLSLVLSLAASFLVPSGVANAWSGYLPQCSNFPTTWQDAIEADYRFTANTSWVAFERDWQGAPFYGSPALIVVWNPPDDSTTSPENQIYFNGNGMDATANGLNFPFGASSYRVLDDELVDATWGGVYSYRTLYDLSCIQDTHNTRYANWVGYHYSDSVGNNQGPARSVALGDSYSSGEGNPPFEYETDVSNQNGCHRSSQAYPRLLQNNPALDVGPTAFMACSGATTANITGGQWNEPPQTDALTNETEIVTLTVGGNDVGFTDYAFACTVTCGYGSIPYNTIMGKINDPDFKDDLVDTYEAVLGANENLDLYVADYPHLTAEDTTTCVGLDLSGAYDVQEALNGVIHDAVIEVGLNSSHIFMVETNYSGSPFEGGHLCNGGASLFNGIEPNPLNLEYSLHPNAAGQAAYAEVFEEYIS